MRSCESIAENRLPVHRIGIEEMSGCCNYREYMNWARRSANILASKVHVCTHPSTQDIQSSVSQVDPHYRGLFATERIYPGEIILFIPSDSILSLDMLLHRGSREGTPHTTTLLTLEDDIFLFLEEFRRECGGGWRGDDSLALYLIAIHRLISTHADKVESVYRHGESFLPVAWANKIEECDPEPVVATEVSDNQEVTVLSTYSPVIDTQVQQHHDLSFVPFVKMLPQSFPTHPLFFTEKEMELLEGTNCHGFITRMTNQIKSDWQQLCVLLETFFEQLDGRSHDPTSSQHVYHSLIHQILHPQKLTIDDYYRALSIIYSRGTDIFMQIETQNGDGRNEQQSLPHSPCHQRIIVPLMDMINHRLDGQVEHVIDTSGNVSVFNSSPNTIEPGEEIFLNYGRFGNDKLLLAYGFVLPNNSYDVVPIYAPLPSSDPMYSIKVNLLRERCGINDPNDPHLLSLSLSDSNHAILPDSLLSTLRLIGILDQMVLIRFLFMTDSERETVDDDLSESSSIKEQYAEKYPSAMIPIISIENETSALQALNDALDFMARRLALNLISDEHLTAGMSIESNQNINVAKSKQQITPASNTEEFFIQELNQRNIKTLVESEYYILIAALEEIHERLEQLTYERVENPQQRSS